MNLDVDHNRIQLEMVILLKTTFSTVTFQLVFVMRFYGMLNRQNEGKKHGVLKILKFKLIDLLTNFVNAPPFEWNENFKGAYSRCEALRNYLNYLSIECDRYGNQLQFFFFEREEALLAVLQKKTKIVVVLQDVARLGVASSDFYFCTVTR